MAETTPPRDERAESTGGPPVLCLHSTTGWPAPALEEHEYHSVVFSADADLENRVAEAAAAADGLGGAVHVVASGPDGVVAVRLAVTRPELVQSLVLADCSASNDLGSVTEDLPRVTVPALVVAASPDGETGLEESQTLAGQIPNGVFVVMDHVELPAYGTRPGSFSAWSNSFLSIVEGLRALDAESTSALPTDPTPTSI